MSVHLLRARVGQNVHQERSHMLKCIDGFVFYSGRRRLGVVSREWWAWLLMRRVSCNLICPTWQEGRTPFFAALCIRQEKTWDPLAPSPPSILLTPSAHPPPFPGIESGVSQTGKGK